MTARGWMRTASLVALCGLTLVGTACSTEAHHPHKGEYPITQAFKTDAEIMREYVAQIRAIQHIEIRAMERGYLEEILLDEGRSARKGQKLFQILPVVYQAERQRAAAEVEFAEIEFQNTKALRDRDVVSPNELALAKARLDKAKAELAVAQVHLSQTEIRAPFDGIMNRLEVRKGSLLDEGELLTTLADNSQMWVYFNVTESEYLDYREKVQGDGATTVKLRMANNKLFPHDGHVDTIEADFNNETGNIAFRATFPNPDGLLRHGETGKIVMATVLEDVLLVPQKATYDILDKKFVFVVDDERVVHAREITVQEELPHVYVIGSGLEPEDRILLEGLRKVRDGDTIDVRFEDPEGVIVNQDLHAE